jgi:AP-1 complex subunit gamma-1
MSLKLRDLIRKVRQCKTAAEERAVIAKESAMIRTAIREEQAHYRHRNVAKLLFMHMLGYPTHFGQLECMKLTASPHFPEKRIGYLGMMLLLSEDADVLMLSTNALKNDLTSSNKFVAGLALCAIGNLATADMSRDLAPEVDKHLKSPMPYIRKKACLAMSRCLSKCPDMVEDFIDRVITLLKDKSHGVLITVAQLMTQILMIDFRNAEEEGEDPFATPCRQAFLRLVPTLVKMLRNLLSTGYSPEHDIGGISDPFLQVQLLTLLRLLGANNEEASEEMNDVLAQVATNTETSKNAGNAILYECVQTIMGIESEDGLRILAVNILGRFLLNRDNNIRYVALNTLARCIIEQKRSGDMIETGDGEETNSAMSALQRHRTTVVECLKDPDVSIRQRALELIYHLVNDDNVESLTAELLNYLVLCPREHRGDICSRILRVVDRYSPDDRWRVDTLITTLTIAGREAARDVQSSAVVYISRGGEDIHSFATHKLIKAIRDDDGSQHGLLAVGIWCIGEYGDLLLKPYTYTHQASDVANFSSNGGLITFHALDSSSVIDTIEHVAKRHACPEMVKQRALTAYVKLSQRLANSGDQAALDRLRQLLKNQNMSHSLELQLRSCEYSALVNASRGMTASAPAPVTDDIFGMTNDNAGGSVSDGVINAAKEALARMPVIDMKVLQKRLSTSDWDDDSTPRIPRGAAKKDTSGGDLLDLNDIFGAAPTPETTQNGATSVSGAGETGKSDLDLLSDIFAVQAATGSAAAPVSNGTFDLFAAPVSQPAPAPVDPMDLFGAPPASTNIPASTNNVMDLFGSSAQGQSIPAPPHMSQPMDDLFGSAPALAGPSGVKVSGPSHAGLSIEFECTKPDTFNQQKSVLTAHFKNTSGDTIYGMNLQCAVPKYVTMEMEPPTSTTIPVSGGSSEEVTQKITVTNSMLGTKNLMLKLKLSFTATGEKIEHMATASGFPAGQY